MCEEVQLATKTFESPFYRVFLLTDEQKFPGLMTNQSVSQPPKTTDKIQMVIWMQLFCLQLEASRLQWSFSTYS